VRYPFSCLRAGICALTFALSSAVSATDTGDSTYFIFDGNPVAAKYILGRMVRLPVQDAGNVESLSTLEAVSALLHSPRLSTLSMSAKSPVVHVSPPRMPEYGIPMFEVSIGGSVAQKIRAPTLIWSGSTAFREIVFSSPRVGGRLKQALIAQSRRLIIPMLDFRLNKRVGRRLKIDGPVSVRDYGRTEVAPHLAFVDVTWRIRDLPDALANNGIDSWSPYLRVEYIVNTGTGKTVYRNTTNVGGVEESDMHLFKEPDGPLLMAVSITCSDGSEPLILDLERETYGTGHSDDVPHADHCFPAQ
jgi:hypothetical protein